MKLRYISIVILCSFGLTQFCWNAQEHFISEKDFIYQVGTGNISLIDEYLDTQGNINAQDKKGMTALHWVVVNGYNNVAEKLLAEHANPNIQNNEGKTPLQLAAKNGNIAAVKDLIHANAHLDSADKKGYTALHKAVTHNHSEIVEILLSNNADPNIQNFKGETPLYSASKWGKATMVSDLLHARADANITDNEGHTPLHAASWQNHFPVVQLLIENGHPKIDAKDNKNITPLLSTNDPDIFNELVQNGATLTAQDKKGRTIMHRTTNPEIVKLALESGLNPNLPDKQGKTPLIQAVIEGNVAAIPYLLKHGADVNLKDTTRGRSPLLWAIRMHEESIIHEPTDSPEYLRKKQRRLSLKAVIKIINALAQDPSLDLHSKDNFGHDVYYYIQQPEIFPSAEARKALLDVLQKIWQEQKTRHVKTRGW